MASFANTINPTPFGFFDSDTEFQTEADAMVTFVKRSLGDDVLSVELTKRQIWSAFEEATLEFSSLINQHQARSQLLIFLGQDTTALTGSEQKYPIPNLEHLVRAAEPYAMEAGIGGVYESFSGSISLEPGQQDYNIYDTLKDTAGNLIVNHVSNSVGGQMRIREVFHFSPGAAYRFFDTTSAVNYLNNEFSFESFTPETIFYVLPVFEDILRAGQLDISQRVRRSNYSYKIMGPNIRVFPTPTNESRDNLYLRIQFSPDPLASPYGDGTIDGVSNIADIPFGNLVYENINSIARQWIRQYCLARCKEILGLIRSKFSTVPIPGSELTLNGAELVAQGREDQNRIRDQMIEMLDKLTYEALQESELNKAKSMQEILRMVPVPNGGAIIIG